MRRADPPSMDPGHGVQRPLDHHATLERVYLDGTTLVIETTFGRTLIGLRPEHIQALREALCEDTRNA